MVELYAFRLRQNMSRTMGELLEETLSVRDPPSHDKRRVFEQLDSEISFRDYFAAGNKRLVDFFMPIASLLI